MLAADAAFAADDFFEKGGGYDFDPSLLGEAHGECHSNVAQAMFEEIETIAVHNTFSQPWESESYFKLAATHGYSVFIVECQNDFGSIHGVPADIIEGMRERWVPLNRPPLALWRISRVRIKAVANRVKGFFEKLAR
jgi:hypothetical protein